MRLSLRKAGIVSGAIILLLGNGVSTVSAAQAHSNPVYSISSAEKSNVIDFYEIGYSEEVIIDGDNYVYNYAYENGKKVINIINETNKVTEKIIYNEEDSTVYHNNEAIGSGSIGIIAASSIGGTVRVRVQEYVPWFGAPQYRYLWSFTASTGDFYGTYISHSVTPYGSWDENEE